MRLWTELCLDASGILDVGANNGLYSLVAKAFNPRAEVYSFEPIVRFAQRLLTNRDLNHFDINLYNIAVSDQEGEAMIYDLPFDQHGHSSLIKAESARASVALVERKVKTTRLDTFLKRAGIDRVDLMKIDVEGSEPEVLEGMGLYLRQMHPTMLVEIKRTEQAYRICSLIKDLDYLYYNVDEEKGPQRMSDLAPSRSLNYLLCSKGTATKLNLV